MKKSLGANIFLALLVLFIFLAGLEMIQRIRHPHVGFRNMCNSLGFRNPEFNPEKQAGTLRMLFVGSSTTFGMDAPVETTFPFLVEKILKNKIAPFPIETINASQPCKTSYWEVKRIEETLYLKPDIILVMTGYNDAASIYENLTRINERGDLVLTPWHIRLDTWIAQHSVFYVTLREKIAILRYGSPLFAFTRPPNPGQETSLDHSDWFLHYPAYFRNNLEQMISICSAHHIKLIFIKPPVSPQRREERPYYEQAYRKLMEELTTVCLEHNIPMIDLSDFYSNSAWREYVASDGLHFTIRGNAEIASRVANYFIEHKKNYF